MPDDAVQGALKQPFKEQVAFFRQKLGNMVPTEKWTDMQREQYDKGFMVAGAQSADLLSDFAAAIDKGIAQGTGIEEFRKDFDDIVKNKGWSYKGERNWRTRVIYNTNLSTSYAAGRLAQLQEEGHEFWVYRHSDTVSHPRKQHVAWDRLTLKADDSWWSTHFPPNGWGCQCRIIGARNEKAVKRYGGILGPAPQDKIDPKTGAPVGIDKGWDYMPGGTVANQLRSFTPTLVDELPKGKPALDGPICKFGSVRLSESDECPGPIPKARPFDESKLLAPDLSEVAYVRAFLHEFGADIDSPKVFKDVVGERLVISDELFLNRKKTAKQGKKVYKVMKRERNIYLPMLAQTIIDPQEIWTVPEQILALGGKWVYRRRYIAFWELPNEQKNGLAVFESIDKKKWTGITTFILDYEDPAEMEKYINQLRSTGVLEYKKK